MNQASCHEKHDPAPALAGARYAADTSLPPVRFADASARSLLGREGTLVLRLERLGPSARGRLSDVIDEAMERELAARGATSPGMGSSLDPDAALSDQLFRARQVGVERVCLALGPLRLAMSPSGAMQAEDTATLRFWAQATKDRPVELVLDAADELAQGFVTPVPLKEALGLAPPIQADDVATAALVEETPEPTLAPPPVTIDDEAPPPAPAHDPEQPAEARARADEGIVRHTAGAAIGGDDGAWRTWMLALHAAKGPQSLASFERLFVQSYLPLCHAVDQGLRDPRAEGARDEFRTTFVRMYTEACPAFAATGKRPRMVFDAPEVAARIARQHGARSVHLLMASGMRFDVGALVKESLVARMATIARVADELILWSALPTTTSRQLDCLSRGADALRSPTTGDADEEVLRGRTAETIRRAKIGSRDVYKLDACEARMREASSGALEAIPAVARTLADVVLRHAKALAPRTLLFVFGDHGFTLDASGSARSGGASPEEVLVPALALLTGDVH